jgi:hypothetical protein
MLNNVPMLRAGDVLLIAFEGQQTEEDTKRFVAELTAVLPGVRVAFMEGVSGLAAFRPGPPESESDCGDSTNGTGGE